jgi:hypothetical protein
MGRLLAFPDVLGELFVPAAHLEFGGLVGWNTP